MFRLHACRRFFSWLALLAVLGGAMAPTVSHALNSEGGWLEVCTAQGIKIIQVESAPGEQGPSDPRHQIHLEHCPFCVPHAGSLGLRPAAEQVFRLPQDRSSFFPPLFFSAPQSLFVWVSANPRAPPALSI